MSKCPNRLDGQHVYKYDGDFKCRCGRMIKYDIVARDFVAVDGK